MMSRTMERFVFRTVSQVSNKVPAWEAILARLSDQECDLIDEEDLWEEVSHSQKSPHFGNAYQYLLLSRIKRLTEEQYPQVEVDYFINALDSHLYLNKASIWDEACFFATLESLTKNIQIRHLIQRHFNLLSWCY